MFDNFDPNNFDPNNFSGGISQATTNVEGKATANIDGVTVMTGSTMAQFDIRIVNLQAIDVQVQLFSMINSIAFLTVAGFAGTSLYSGAGIVSADLTSHNYFNGAGDLVLQNAADALCTISCPQIPYWSLLQSSSRQPFHFKKIRLTVTNDPQIDNEMLFTENTWLGKVNSNRVTPRTYFNPNQFQGKIVDIPAAYTIDFEKGLSYKVNAAENLNLSFFVDGYRKLVLS